MIITEAPPRQVAPESLLREPDGLRAWLQLLPANASVGVPETLFSCPLALYLKSQGVRYPAVGPMSVRWNDQNDGCRYSPEFPRYRLPDWARRFVGLVDSRTHGECVSAGQALELLALAEERA